MAEQEVLGVVGRRRSAGEIVMVSVAVVLLWMVVSHSQA